MGWGLDLLLATAETVADWPQAVLRVPPLPDWGLGLLVLGGLWLCLWQRPWRAAGLLAILAGALAPLGYEAPDVLVSDDGRLIALRDAEARLWLPTQRGNGFVRDTWVRQAFAHESVTWPHLGEAAGGRLSCDPLACLYRAEGATVAVLMDPRAAEDDCHRAEVVVSLEPLRRQPCAGPRVVIDRFDMWREGAHAVWLRKRGRGCAASPDSRARGPGHPTRRAPSVRTNSGEAIRRGGPGW
jgi:competence protein ComEC